MYRRILLLVAIMLLAVFRAEAQSHNSGANRDLKGSSPMDKKSGLKDLDEDPQDSLNLPDEMRVKMLIDRREQDYKKIMESVDKLNSLSGEIATNFHEHGKLSGADVKKLESIEKLAHQVLVHSGGEAVDDKGRAPMQMGEAIDKIGEAAENIKKNMTSETRFVVSATVIANSNELINLSRLVRRQQKN
ncbi:MAG TPA: hypothetical protein VKM94_02030 [Blastocatellia bacterium]|nr:hypothetical protein [Blastocatellia bacterium]